MPSIPPPHDIGGARRHGWMLLGGAFLTFALSAALMHAYGVYLLAFLEEFGWTRADTSIAYAVSQLVGGFISWPIGVMVDRLGPRRLLVIGGVLLAAGLYGSAHASQLWHIVLLYGVVMTIGGNCLGLVVFVPILSRLFAGRRGMAISIVQSASGFGRAAAAPFGQIAISMFGWRDAYVFQAALMAVLVLPLAALFRGAERPAPPSTSSGAAASRATAPTVNPPVRAWTITDAMATSQFWLLFLVYLCTGLGSFFVSLHQLAFAVDMGFDKLYAAQVIGFGALLSVVGIVMTGTVSDHIGRELAGILAYGVSILGVTAALLITGPDDHLLLWVHSCLFGITWGSRGPTITAKVADLFPGPNLGAVLGVVTIGSGIGAAAGSWGAGWIFDFSGSYRLAFWLSIGAYVVGSIAYWAVRRAAP
ncbi:MAG: MFS transporter [Alphaproteobacteria bacterium]|nr:MFS transporter [Alphaproteobacteria bacterium]